MTDPRTAEARQPADPARLARLAHEMRGRLNGVIGMAELLHQTRLSEQQCGFLDTLSQSAESLLSLVNDLQELAGPTAGPAGPAVTPAAPPAGARVLLAEDNKVNQQVLTLLLEKAGYRVAVADNGKQALELLDRERFDLVLMDVQMPEMDGLRATRLIRQREKAVGGHVPIVAVTANALQGERQRCLAAGMDDYLSKPVRGAELFATLSRLLGAAARPEAAPAPGEPAWVAPLAAMGFDLDAVAKLARTFLDTVPPRLAALRQAVRDGQADQVRLTAHSLKGSLTVFAAQAATDAAWRLEQAGREQSLGGAEAALDELATCLNPLLASMREYLGA